MKTIKTLSKFGKIMFGLLGIAALFASCHKEKDCKCTEKYSGTYNGETYSYTDEYVVAVEEKCWELNMSSTDPEDGSTYSVECEKK